MLVAKLTPQEFTVTDVYFIEHLSLKETAKRNVSNRCPRCVAAYPT